VELIVLQLAQEHCMIIVEPIIIQIVRTAYTTIYPKMGRFKSGIGNHSGESAAIFLSMTEGAYPDFFLWAELPMRNYFHWSDPLRTYYSKIYSEGLLTVKFCINISCCNAAVAEMARRDY
jgi:hypothetical protein